MTKRTLSSTLALTGLGLALITGCQSSDKPGHVPAEYFQGSTLDRNEIKARATTEYLEVAINPEDMQLRLTETANLRAFFADYNARGHGPLIMSAPKNAPNPQLAVEAVVEARELAWESGIDYTEIAGSAYDATGRPKAPLVLAFKAYTAVAPECTPLSQIDFADATSNSDLPTLGCSVRTNMAAMIADPADIYGLRELEGRDAYRGADHLQKWRLGASTGAERNGAESGAVSTAVN